MQPLAPLSPVPTQLPLPSADARSVQASRQFEVSLIASLLESAEKTYAALPGQDSFAGSENYDYLATQALASAIASHGGFGIGRLIDRYLAEHS
jgi:hypothetical protein